MLNSDAKPEWLTIFIIGLLLGATTLLLGLWPVTIFVAILTAALLAFFRDPERAIPTHRGIMTSPADGKISSIHELEFFEPFNGPAVCIRIFLSVFDVHVNRSPVHGVVTSVRHKPGEHLNVLNPDSAEVNESNLIILAHPMKHEPIAAVRQVAGLLARTITCNATEGAVVQRGQRIGIIKLGSTTELYIPKKDQPAIAVEKGQYVYAGTTILAHMENTTPGSAPEIDTTPENATESTPQNEPKSTPTADNVSEPHSQNTAASENDSDQTPQSGSDSVPQNTPDITSENEPESLPENLPENNSENTAENLLENAHQNMLFPEETAEEKPDSDTQASESENPRQNG